MSDAEIFESLVNRIARAIVDEEDGVQVNVVEGHTAVLVELNVAPADKGKVIGREGSMAWAIRTILTNVATRLNKKVVLHIID